jgi:hypothetical protein
VPIYAYAHPGDFYQGRSAYEHVHAYVALNGLGGPRSIGLPSSAQYTFLKDDGSDTTQLGTHVVRAFGLRPEQMVTCGVAAQAAGDEVPILTFDGFLFLRHERRFWQHLPSVDDYSMFRVGFSVPGVVFTDPTGKGSDIESLVGQDVLRILHHEGGERIIEWKDRRTKRPKLIRWDIKPNYRVRWFGRDGLLREVHDVRHWDLVHREIRESLGLRPAAWPGPD